MNRDRGTDWPERWDDSTFVLAAVVTDLDRASAAAAADAVEFRMDLATAPVDQLAEYDAALPVIATNRRDDEGGEARGDDRLETLAAAAEHPAVTAVDVELASIEAGRADALLATCEKTETDVLVSWHDFEGTPAATDLERRLRSAAAHGSIAKAAVTASTVADVLTVLRVTHRLATDGIPVATMCMGEAGRHSRVVAPLYGSRIAYAPIDPAEATAPGQFDLETMAELLDVLR